MEGLTPLICTGIKPSVGALIDARTPSAKMVTEKVKEGSILTAV
jgi:hypothetical protein